MDYSVYIHPFERGDDSHALLRLAAAHCTGLPPESFSTEAGPQGKPHFPGHPALHFSLSHSGAWWLCAFGGAPVGLDLQEHRPCPREKLTRRFFHPAERALLEAEDYGRFFAVWAAKESYLKYTGHGLHDRLDGFSVAAGGTLASEVRGARLRPLDFCPGYSLCLCAGDPGRVTLLRDWRT